MSVRSKARQLSLLIKLSILSLEIAFGIFLIVVFYMNAGAYGLLIIIFFTPAVVALPNQITQLLDLIGNAPLHELRNQHWERQLENERNKEQGRFDVPTRK
jgi:hypothetical protein